MLFVAAKFREGVLRGCAEAHPKSPLPEPRGQRATAWRYLLLVSEPATMELGGKGSKRLKDREHFLQTELGSKGALPVDGAGDSVATSCCGCVP